MEKRRRILSLSLVLAMVLGLFSGTTFVSNALDLGYSYIISSANSKMVHADTGKSDVLTASASEVTDAEAFKLVNNEDGTVSFLCKQSDNYIAPHDNGNKELVSRKNDSFTDWQKFILEPQADGTVAIKSVKTDRYVTVDLNNDATLTASSKTIGNKEKFTFVTPKTPPTGLDISSNTADSVTVNWMALPGAVSYNIYRSTSRFGTYEKLNSAPVTSNSYTDTGLTTTTYYYKVEGVSGNVISDLSAPISMELKLFGSNVYVFAPSDDPVQVQQICSNVFAQQEAAQFGDGRYALLFKPGTYDNSIQFNVGFYTQVSGLGRLPTDTVINKMTVDATWKWQQPNNFNATCNFWRSIENITLNSDTMWAVSQAAPLRRLQVNGSITFDHYGGWSSGGFLADSVVTGNAGSSSQQQWLTRNSNAAAWTGVNWNYELVGTNGTTPTKTDGSVTVVPNASVTREKPFLYFDGNGYNVFVPGVITNLKGTSWSAGDVGPGISMPISSFFVAKPTDSAATINAQLDAGKSLIFTPGIYNIDETIHVTKPDTIVLGLGLASIVPQNGITAMIVDDVDGVSVSGLIFDAGRDTGSGVRMSPYLMQVGQSKNTVDHSSNPIWLSDIFFRVGGAGMAQADTCLEINANNVIGDDFWLWRADHGDGVGWDQNISNYGLVVNGDNMTMYGLFSEHFEKYAVLWNGENGKTYFFQNELPYDVPSQADWMTPAGRNGYAAYKVADNVNNHEALGLGVYAVFIDNNGAPITLDSAIEVPDKDGVVIRNACTVNLSGTSNQSSQITNIVNNYGASTSRTTFSTTYITGYSCPKPAPVINAIAYDGGYHVTITPAAGIPADANIYYTLDGTVPTINSQFYKGPFDVIDDGVTKTLRAAVITTTYQQPAIPGAATLTFAPLTPMQITVQKGVFPGDSSDPTKTALAAPVNPITITIANAGSYDAIRYIKGNTLNTATEGSPVVNGVISIVPDRVQGATNYTIKAFKGVKATVITIPVSYSLAIGAPTVTSSVTSTNVGANAVDSIVGSTGQSNITRWESGYTGTNNGPTYKDEYIYVDLGANFNISRVILQWWSSNSIGRDFTIDVAPDGTTDLSRNGTSWTNVVEVAGMNNSSNYYTWDTAKSAAAYGNPGTYINGFNTNTYTARYVRMRGTRNGAGLTSSGFSISDFAVFGTPTP